MVEHSLKKSVLPAENSPVAIRRRAWRELKDRLARYGVAIGGISVIFAIVLIFFYLLYVVIPLFYGADIESKAQYSTKINNSIHLTLNEYNDVALTLDIQGKVAFFDANSGKTILDVSLPLPEQAKIVSFSKGSAATGVFAYGFDNGQALVFQQDYKISYPEGTTRKITPSILYPLGEQAQIVDANGQALRLLSVQSNADQTTLVALTQDNRVVLKSLLREEDFMDEDAFTIEEKTAEVKLDGNDVITHVQIDIDQQELYLADKNGFIRYFDISDIEAPRLIQKIKGVPSGVTITSL